jgi:hypothetical protein
MNIGKLKASQFFKADDFVDGPKTLEIASVDGETMTQDDGSKKLKGVVSFADADQKLVLNSVNLETIGEALGDETDNWIGKQITLLRDKTRFGNKTVPCVRVRVDGDGIPV